MFGTKKLAKRSIVGTPVCALCAEDGIYYPGMITSTSEWSAGCVVYSVFHRESKITKTYQVCYLALLHIKVPFTDRRRFYVVLVPSFKAMFILRYIWFVQRVSSSF